MITGKSGYLDLTGSENVAVPSGGSVTNPVARVFWEETYDISTNKSIVAITDVQIKSGNFSGDFESVETDASVARLTVDGTIAQHFHAPSYVVKAELEEGVFVSLQPAGTYSEQFPWEVTVEHGDDGTRICTIDLALELRSGSLGSKRVSFLTSGTIELTDIPRASGMEVTGDTLGAPMTFSITKEDAGALDTITYKCGSESGTIVSLTGESEVTWMPPLSLARQNTTGTTVPITFTLTTYYDGIEAGSAAVSRTLTIPDSVVPSVSVEIEDAYGYFDTYAAYVQGKSSLTVQAGGVGIYGSTIAGYTVEFDGKKYVYADVFTEEIKGSGDLSLVATVKDSRGRTASVTVTVPVLLYESPKVENLTAVRCKEDGTLSSSGAYLQISFDAAVSPLNDRNSAVYTLQYRKRTEEAYLYQPLENLEGAYAVSGAVVVIAAATSSSFDIVVSAQDDFASVPKSTVAQSVKKLWSHLIGSMGWAFGKVAEFVDTLDIAWKVYMNGNQIKYLGEPTEAADAATKGYVDQSIQQIKDILAKNGISVE